MSDGGTSVIRRRHLMLRVDKRTLNITYTGNMGSSMLNVNGELRSLGLFDIDSLRQIPSFYESGSPDYMYSATVTLSDLSPSMKARISSLLQKVSTTNTTPESDSSADLSDAGRTFSFPERCHAEEPGSDDATEDQDDGATGIDTIHHLAEVATLVGRLRAESDGSTEAMPSLWGIRQKTVTGAEDSVMGDVPVGSPLFLTRDACERHIEANVGSYDDPEPVRMQASPISDVTSLLSALMGIDWEEIVRIVSA